MKCSFDTSVGQRKILSAGRESNPWPPKYRLGALTTELRETRCELGHLPRFICDTRPTYCSDQQYRKHHNDMCNKQ